jgi:hypothetical protein
MIKKTGWILIILIIIGVGFFLTWGGADAQFRRSEFPETGHILSGEFYDFYWSAENPILVYGYPITDVTTDINTGRLVQYFQRAVFVLDNQTPSDIHIQLAPIGEYLYEPGESVSVAGKSTNCQNFSETGFQVCYAFLDFFRENGGVEQFGLPISNFEYKYGRIVQYFQNARFEWYPELPSKHRVKLADLGSEFFYTVGEPPIKQERNEILQDVIGLGVRAFPQSAVTTLVGSQTIYVLVQDQNLFPVPGAQVEGLVEFPSGSEKRYQAPETDANGVTSFSFDVETIKPGRAFVQIFVAYQELSESTKTSFRIWW